MCDKIHITMVSFFFGQVPFTLKVKYVMMFQPSTALQYKTNIYIDNAAFCESYIMVD